MKDAVSQARRLEASNLTGLNPGRADSYASAVAFTQIPNRSAIAQQYTAVKLRAAESGASSGAASGAGFSTGNSRNNGGGGTGGGGGGGGGGGSGNNNRNRNRPRCTYPGCRKPLGHTIDVCYQRQREENGGGSSSDGNGGGGGTVEVSSKQAELQSYKSEVRAKTIAVGKAEITLNDLCLSMARRVGRAEGVHVSESKGGVLLEVHETPAEFAAHIKKNILAQLTKWEIDRAALQAKAENAGNEAADAAKSHEAERADLFHRVEALEERIREMEVDSQRNVAEAKAVAVQSREESTKASSAMDELAGRLEAASLRNKELCKNIEDNEKQFQEQQKDSLIALARERDEFELCVKELRARNSWLEKQVLGAPSTLRCVAEEQVKAVAKSEEVTGPPCRATTGTNGGWTSNSRYTGDSGRAPSGGVRKSDDPVSRLEHRLEVQRGHGRGGVKAAQESGWAEEHSTARIRRNIRFLEDCDR
eukprot:g10606.t1